MTNTTYKPLPEDWTRRSRSSPILMTWSTAPRRRWPGGQAGKAVVYVMVTNGEAGIDAMAPEECRPMRERSSSSRPARRRRRRGVPRLPRRRHRVRAAAAPGGRGGGPPPPARVILTNNLRVTSARRLQQADHSPPAGPWSTGSATPEPVDLPRAARPGPGQVGGARRCRQRLARSRARRRRHRHLDLGVESLRAHRAYIDGLGWEHFDEVEFLESFCRPAGSAFGTTYATDVRGLLAALGRRRRLSPPGSAELR